MKNKPDPITAALTTGTALLELIEKALPGETERIERFRARAPQRYINLQNRAFRGKLKRLKQLNRFMRKNKLSEQQIIEQLKLINTITAQ